MVKEKCAVFGGGEVARYARALKVVEGLVRQPGVEGERKEGGEERSDSSSGSSGDEDVGVDRREVGGAEDVKGDATRQGTKRYEKADEILRSMEF
jgi:hypothetical protein